MNFILGSVDMRFNQSGKRPVTAVGKRANVGLDSFVWDFQLLEQKANLAAIA